MDLDLTMSLAWASLAIPAMISSAARAVLAKCTPGPGSLGSGLEFLKKLHQVQQAQRLCRERSWLSGQGRSMPSKTRPRASL